ncbi:hypothetical protein CR3_gp223 [Cronobacter phage CR3]|uniref:Uncharacterized protein n=2 Tax=root TaxID=1 RepID=I1TRR5_9CAUD|nr:hypothetical protein CR3_gp223 [Cronobacter phage CR3]AFH21388.1 hypothetical protein CR3_223 [Cronobacter phage CR3]
MFISQEMKKALDKKQAHRDNGDQFKYRIQYDPRAYFFKYRVQEFRYCEGSYECFELPVHYKGWKTLRRFTKLSSAEKILNELERVNGYLAPMPKWYREEWEH